MPGQEACMRAWGRQGGSNVKEFRLVEKRQSEVLNRGCSRRG